MLHLLLQLAAPVFDPVPTPDQQEVIDAELDSLRRLTVAVGVDGRTQRFLVDTGAERTVVSDLIAARLPGPRESATMIHMAGTSPVEIVEVPALTFGRSVYERLQAPILARRVMGVDGVLGTDALQDQRVLFDFAQGQVTLVTPGEQTSLPGEIVIRARRQSGRLILTSADIDGIDVDVVVDTGAGRTVGNPALAGRLVRRQGTPDTLTSITGDTIAIRKRSVRQLEIGSLVFRDFEIGIVDSPAFAALGLAERPAILLGMDAIGNFRRVLIDFPERRVRFQLATKADRVRR